MRSGGRQERENKRCQEPFLYAPSLVRSCHGQHGGPGSVGARGRGGARGVIKQGPGMRGLGAGPGLTTAQTA